MTIDQIRLDTNFLVSTTTANYPDADLIRNVNTRFDDTVSLILQSDTVNWPWDDSNQTDYPVGPITLVNGQQDYDLTGLTGSLYLEILRVEVKDNNGKFTLLQPFNEKEITQALPEYLSTDSLPLYYRKLGDSLFLYPKPSSANVTLTAGLKVYYKRLPSYFLTTDTTKSPGFAALYHRILSIGAALDYAIKNELIAKINILTPMLQKLQDGLVQHYSSRSGDVKVSLKGRNEDYGGGGYSENYNSDVAFY